ncbi:MAG: hypothetical protein A2W31_12130 [Planctomycetes bacterium RBG_16_64_10]|nr:MAG: hypothetical protein A2W31_12130 [Planctomycetes bacterium RBG_16_64_10]
MERLTSEGIRILGDRVLTIQLHDLNERSAAGHDVPWGTGQAEFARLVQEVHRLGIRPTRFGLEYSHDFLDNMPEMAECVAFFDQISVATPP